jgi:hypothetical protein
LIQTMVLLVEAAIVLDSVINARLRRDLFGRGDDEGCWVGRDSQRLDLLAYESLGFHDLIRAIFGIR